DADGTKNGFDTDMLTAIRAAVGVPLIASGGAGALDHFPEAVGAGADAVLAAVDAVDPAAGLRFNDAGLVCAVVQQYDTKEVLMVAWMDAEALRRTISTGAGTYWSRSRQEYWVKGATSGHTQRVVEVRRDCDGDTVLVLVEQT